MGAARAVGLSQSGPGPANAGKARFPRAFARRIGPGARIHVQIELEAAMHMRVESFGMWGIVAGAALLLFLGGCPGDTELAKGDDPSQGGGQAGSGSGDSGSSGGNAGSGSGSAGSGHAGSGGGESGSGSGDSG